MKGWQLIKTKSLIILYSPSDTDGSRRNSIVERRQSIIVNQGVNILNNNDLSDTGSSLHTLIFHGLQEDWMEQNMETMEKKQMVLELNVRKVNLPKIFYQLT